MTRLRCVEDEERHEERTRSDILGTYWFQALTQNKACVHHVVVVLLFGATRT